MKMRAAILTFSGILGWAAVTTSLSAQEKRKRPVEGIMDNSFLVEEAYNQEEGVVQHIFNGVYGADKIFGPVRHALDLSFTQEWPLFGQTHQFSYTVPYGFAWEHSQSGNGLRDVLLNYRYQAYFAEKTLTGFAPRFSLVVPTGDDDKGFGNGVLGYQWSLPLSTALGDQWYVHANAGLTWLPGVGSTRSVDLLSYNAGASVIYCVSDRFNLMLEWIGNWNEDFDGSGISHEFSSVISPGARYAFNFANGSQLVLGVGLPIGLTAAAPDLGAFLYFSFEHRLFGKKAGD